MAILNPLTRPFINFLVLSFSLSSHSVDVCKKGTGVGITKKKKWIRSRNSKKNSFSKFQMGNWEQNGIAKQCHKKLNWHNLFPVHFTTLLDTHNLSIFLFCVVSFGVLLLLLLVAGEMCLLDVKEKQKSRFLWENWRQSVLESQVESIYQWQLFLIWLVNVLDEMD